jgi:hypothetical protein
MKRLEKRPVLAKPKRSPEPDVNERAHQLIKAMTEGPRPVAVPSKEEISRVMSALGRKGGKIGGVVRAAGMTPERRREIALKAARKRWDKK